jgi:hypothetical protein
MFKPFSSQGLGLVGGRCKYIFWSFQSVLSVFQSQGWLAQKNVWTVLSILSTGLGAFIWWVLLWWRLVPTCTHHQCCHQARRVTGRTLYPFISCEGWMSLECDWSQCDKAMCKLLCIYPRWLNGLWLCFCSQLLRDNSCCLVFKSWCSLSK